MSSFLTFKYMETIQHIMLYKYMSRAILIVELGEENGDIPKLAIALIERYIQKNKLEASIKVELRCSKPTAKILSKLLIHKYNNATLGKYTRECMKMYLRDNPNWYSYVNGAEMNNYVQ